MCERKNEKERERERDLRYFFFFSVRPRVSECVSKVPHSFFMSSKRARSEGGGPRGKDEGRKERNRERKTEESSLGFSRRRRRVSVVFISSASFFLFRLDTLEGREEAR